MNMMRIRYYKILICFLISLSTAHAVNKLTVVRTDKNTLEVQLANSEEVGGVQFRLHTSPDVVLGEIERGNRTTESQWLFASYKPNDTLVSVVILNWQLKNFPVGQGSLIRIPISIANPLDKSTASLFDVMIINGQGDSIGVVINNLEWSNNDSKSFALSQNYPNPFNPSTRIAYKLHKAAQVRLNVYDIMGREVNRLIDQFQPVGNYSVEWNSNATSGQKLASGIYFARLSVDNETMTRKMIMAK